MANLLPCPFCGEKRVSLNDPHPDFYRYGSINCPACLVVMPGEVSSQDELIGCWNTRASITDDAQTAVMREIVAQAMLDRFIDRGRVRLGGPTFPDGSKLSDLPSSYSDDFYMDADAILAALAAQPPAAPVAPVERPASFCSRCGGKEPDCYVCKDWPRPQCSAENDDAPNLQRYVAELSLNGRYVWCIVEAIPRKEWVVEQFGCGPDAQKAAYDKLTEAPAPQDRDQLSQIDFMLADGWPNDSVAQPQAAPESSKRDDQEVRTEHGVIKNGRYFNTGKTYWPDGTVKFDFDRSNELDPWFNGTISNDGFINDHD